MTDVAPLSNTEKISPLRLDSKKFAGRELPDIPVAVSRQRGNPRRVLSGITRQSASSFCFLVLLELCVAGDVLQAT